MAELLTAAQMRTIEQAAIQSGEVTGLELMERAGRGVVAAILEQWPEMARTSHTAAVLCGPGNNGGDGFVVARLLKQRGWEVEVFLYGDAATLPPDAKVNCDRWREMGEVKGLEARPSMPVDLLVDALFGTGLARPVDEPELWEWLWLIDDALDAASLGNRTKTVAVDIPSGVCADSGRVLGEAPVHGLRAPRVMLTVTFHAAKLGHYLDVGNAYCGALKLCDIGLKTPSENPETIRLACATPALAKHSGGNKYSHGHALIISGPRHFTGAARLAARGALRIGAGLVTIGAEADAMCEQAAQLTAIMLTEVADAAALDARLEDRRINALCLGPGLGVNGRAKALIGVALASGRPLVLDADAITLLAQHPDLRDLLHKNCILTPHAGEFKRMFPDIMAKLEAPATLGPAYSKVDATREAAARAACTVLFKGADTVIADQTGRAVINSAQYARSAPWLATAGSGDVLAGFITGLLARGFPPMEAAETGAWLHVECARKFGAGLIAEDLPEQLPDVFRDLGL